MVFYTQSTGAVISGRDGARKGETWETETDRKKKRKKKQVTGKHGERQRQMEKETKNKIIHYTVGVFLSFFCQQILRNLLPTESSILQNHPLSQADRLSSVRRRFLLPHLHALQVPGHTVNNWRLPFRLHGVVSDQPQRI